MLLATSQAKILLENGNSHSVRMLIDQGSELSFISEDLIKRLRIRRKQASIPLLGIGGVYSGKTRGIVTLKLQSKHDSSSTCIISAYILTKLTVQLPSVQTIQTHWPHLQGLQLADPDFLRPGSIDIIIGADFYGTIIKPELIKDCSFSPIAQLSIFGWIISGPTSSTDDILSVQGYHCTKDVDLHDLISRFWKQEEIPQLSKTSFSPDEVTCEEHFLNTHSRDSSGRYIVRLPLKLSAEKLGDSTKTALNSLSRLSRRLNSDKTFQQKYSEFIQEYLMLGHMQLIPKSEINTSPIFYLPHHGIIKEQSRTTKLRVVFNGSSRSSSGLSLNDILFQGANLQNDIFDVLLWIRLHKILFSTDIVKMYRQIQVNPEDWNLQRIFWLNPEHQFLSYRLTTVTYGLNCAPFLALRTLQQLVTDEGQKFPLAIPCLTKGRYMDDIFGGADNIQEACQIIKQLKSICKAGGFPLQKWASNSEKMFNYATSSSCNKVISVEIEASLIKILGLHWKPDSDTFHFTTMPFSQNKITKRLVLSEIAQLYDPLGLLSPVLVRAKMFLQELWLAKNNWDEPLSSEMQTRWKTFRHQLQDLDQLSIPRWLRFTKTANSIEIHGFCDASQLAMAAAVYLRVISKQKETSVILVCAKTKVAPLKRLTIPRLELSAALILARLVVHVQRALELKEAPVQLWTDSSVTLTWISSHSSRWKDYVRNRVAIIQELISPGVWRFVSGKDNPADCATRGLQTEKFIHHPLWWNGPSWLSKSPIFWPARDNTPSNDIDMEDRPSLLHIVSSKVLPSYWKLLDRYSSLIRLLRITSICRRVFARCRQIKNSSLIYPITPEELQQSIHFWVGIVQQVWYASELKAISNGVQMKNSNSLIRLTPFLDNKGLLRVGGRLQNSQLDPDTKHPLILPRNSPLSSLIILDAHQKTLHGGTQLTLAYIRQKYWIVGGRAPVRSLILRCVRCARYRGLRAQQLMGQLPTSRVIPSRPFLNSGIDYAGPISIKTWRGRAAKIYKGYIAIFVCFSTSTVHLELVTDYTTEAFIAAFKRFTGRRGICACLYSDCGTNFVGANTILQKQFDSASKEMQNLAKLLANDGTKWSFNPPSAPHFGGKWEAAVKSTKFNLLRTIGDSILTYEELSTVLIQIEAVLNSRPLCPLSDDVEDYTALIPGHFLIGEALSTIPEINLSDQPLSRLSRWQILRQKVEYFWERWKSECLQRYQSISKWHHPSNIIKENSLVLIVDERYPPAKWPLARVIQLHPGADNLTRVVTVRTSTSSFKRPISKLCILPCYPDQNNLETEFPKAGGMFKKQ